MNNTPSEILQKVNEILPQLFFCPKCRCMESGVDKAFLTGAVLEINGESYNEVKTKKVCPECYSPVQPIPKDERRPSRQLRTLGARHLSKMKRAFKAVFTRETPRPMKFTMAIQGIRQPVTTIPYLAHALSKETMTYEDVHITKSGHVYVQYFNRDGKPAGLRRERDHKKALAIAESILAKIQEAEAKAKELEGKNAIETIPGAGQPDAEGRSDAASDQPIQSEAVDRATLDPGDSDRQSNSPDAGAGLAA